MKLLHGDCLEQLKALPESSVDAVVTDPPYGLSFMNKKWDYDVPKIDIWREVLRVLKPGGHLLSFGGTRTYHRLACAIEDAGFEIRDQLQWLYGSGFPKSHNIGDGRGTALKPANEPIVLARKPLEKGLTVAENVLKWGCGALNIDGSRIGSETISQHGRSDSENIAMSGRNYAEVAGRSWTGRWPANIILDETAAEMLDEQSLAGGMHSAGKARPAKRECEPTGNVIYKHAGDGHRLGDSGGASRFFYCAKTSKRERGIGNNHPTVKPIKLMEYLIRLITPPNGIVLDPFMGSGSTGVAAKNLGFEFIGIEREQEYVEIARKRMSHEV